MVLCLLAVLTSYLWDTILEFSSLEGKEDGKRCLIDYVGYVDYIFAVIEGLGLDKRQWLKNHRL